MGQILAVGISNGQCSLRIGIGGWGRRGEDGLLKMHVFGSTSRDSEGVDPGCGPGICTFEKHSGFTCVCNGFYFLKKQNRTEANMDNGKVLKSKAGMYDTHYSICII